MGIFSDLFRSSSAGQRMTAFQGDRSTRRKYRNRAESLLDLLAEDEAAQAPVQMEVAREFGRDGRELQGPGGGLVAAGSQPDFAEQKGPFRDPAGPAFDALSGDGRVTRSHPLMAASQGGAAPGAGGKAKQIEALKASGWNTDNVQAVIQTLGAGEAARLIEGTMMEHLVPQPQQPLGAPLSANITETPATFGITVGRWR